MAGAAACIVLLVAVARARPLHAVGRKVLLGAFLVSAPLIMAAVAPGVAVEPLVAFILAGVLGTHVASLSPPARDSESVPWALAAAGVLVSLYAVYQVSWGLETTAARVEMVGGIPDRDLVLARLGSGRAFATFATPAALGGYLALALPVSVGMGLGRRGRARIVLLTGAGVMVVGMLVTVSVTAVGALVGAALVAAAARFRRWRPLAAAGVVGLLVVLAVVGLRKDEILDRSRPDSPWRLRAGNFRVATGVIADHPWIGVGPGGFGEVFPQYRRPGDNETRHVHDLPLEMMAELGVVPGALAGALFLGLFLGPVLRHDPEEPSWGCGARIGLAAFAIQNLADFTAFFPSILWTAALLRGAIVDPDLTNPGRVSEGWRWTRGGVLAAALVAATLAALAGLSWEARYHARLAAASGDPGRATALARRSTRLAPWNVDAQSMLAQALLETVGESPDRGARLNEALARSNRAVVLSPVRASSREVRARARLALGDTPGAWADLFQAARLYPMRQEYTTLLDEIRPHVPQRPEAVGGAR
jgi:O-antigen ligase